MNRRMAVAMALVVLPTLAFCLFGIRLLRHEGAWLQAQAESAAADRVRAAADLLRVAAASIRADIVEALAALPEDPLPGLERLRMGNPFVRNVFTWNPTQGVLHPPAGSLNPAERAFLAAYAELFSATGAVWQAGQGNADESIASGVPAVADVAEKIAALKYDKRARGPAAGAAPRSARSAWIPWFAGNSFTAIGWLERPDGTIVGAELETMALLARLAPLLPAADGEAAVLALLDANGTTVIRRGADFDLDGAVRVASASLAPYLPHWEVVLYSDRPAASRIGRSFTLLGSLLLAILGGVVVLGGGLFTWEAGRQRLDALRKTTFVSNVSHELRTPLTSIRMYAEMLQDERVPDADKRRRYLAVIVDETQRLTRLVNNVLDFSRMERGHKKYARESIELVGWLREFAEAQRERVRSAGMELAVVTPDAPVEVAYDRDALGQIMLNLLDNAVKYAASGAWVELCLACGAEGVRLHVADRGPGIPGRLRERVFEKFYRADATLTAKTAGSGLGLTLARGMARDLGGDLRLEEHAGGGCVFVLTTVDTQGGVRT